MRRYLCQNPKGGAIHLMVSSQSVEHISQFSFRGSKVTRGGNITRFATLDELLNDSIVRRQIAHIVTDRIDRLSDPTGAATCTFAYPTFLGWDCTNPDERTRTLTVDVVIEPHRSRTEVLVVNLRNLYAGAPAEPTLLALFGWAMEPELATGT
jgi:hypothetical protein